MISRINGRLTKNLVAVFPLPGMVAFEGQQHLLHIFEPRYRKMVEDCLEANRLLGLALPVKRISTVDNSGKSFQEILNSNQNTYEAHNVFGAGPVRILRTLPDGRILIMVHIHHRVQMKNIVQALPYFLAEADFIDSIAPRPEIARFYFDNLLAVSRSILGEKFALFQEKIPEIIQQKPDLQALMLKIMDWFRLDSEMLQELLEEDEIEQRASRFLDYMRMYVEQNLPQYIPDLPEKPGAGKEPEGKIIRVDFKHREAAPESDSF